MGHLPLGLPRLLAFHDERRAIALPISAQRQTIQRAASRAQTSDIAEAAAGEPAAVRGEGDGVFTARIVARQKALHGRRQLHASVAAADEQCPETGRQRRERRQDARVALVRRLGGRGVVALRGGRLRFQRRQSAACLPPGDAGERCRIPRAREIDDAAAPRFPRQAQQARMPVVRPPAQRSAATRRCLAG